MGFARTLWWLGSHFLNSFLGIGERDRVVACILAFTAGVWLLQQQAGLPALSAWFALLVLLLVVWRLRGKVRRWVLLAAWAGGGFLWAASFAHLRLADELPLHWEGVDVRVVGVVAALPAAGERGRRFPFDIEQVLTPGAQVPRHIQLFWASDTHVGSNGPLPEARAGERWRFTVRLKRPHGNVNPHGFDLEVWALERNLRAFGQVVGEGDAVRLAAAVMRPAYFVEAARQAVAERCDGVLAGQPYGGIIKALVIGEQGAISAAQWRVFQRTGVSHLMSISGLHVTMLASLAFFLVSGVWRRVPPLAVRVPSARGGVLFGLAAAFGYAWLSGFGVPTQRTVYMLAVVALALWLGRAGQPVRVLALALLVVLLVDPWAILSPGLWLSFGAVAAIFYAAGGRVGRPGWLRGWVTTQMAVTLGLIPALLVLFQQVSLISPLANALAIPVVSLLVTPLALCGALLPFDGILLAAHQIMAWCMAALELFSRLPGAVWTQHAPPAWTLLPALGGVVWMLAPRGFPGRWMGALLLLPMLLVTPPGPPPGALWLSVLDVGQGLAVLARTERHALLFDTGPRYSADSDAGSRIVVPYLRGIGVRRLDGLIVSHDDSDHSGGAAAVLDALEVGWLASALPDGHPLRAAARQDVLCHVGQQWEWDGVRFAMLHPTLESHADPRVRDNDRGCTLKISAPYGSVLLPADIEARAEREVVARAESNLRAEVLVAAHHGSKSSSTPAFVAAVQPDTVVFASGYRNRFGHPHTDVVTRFRERGTTILRSDWDGALEFRFEAAGRSLTAWRKAEPRYWRRP